MRSEAEMMRLILGFAQEREDVRAVIMTGSRADPGAAPDRFQDYDIVYLVNEVAPYRQNPQVPGYFGDTMILQTPDDMGESPGPATSYTYLMQFMDGNRIDLTFRALADLAPILEDSLSLVLLDKDRRFAVPPPTVRSYLPRKPTAKHFTDCSSEFWWLDPYVAKALYRDQIIYAKAVLDGPMRKCLMEMLTWYFGLTTNFRVAAGQFGKHFKAHLPEEFWELLEQTYSDAQPDQVWTALFDMNELFRRLARRVAGAFDFVCPEREDAAVSSFVQQIRDLCR